MPMFSFIIPVFNVESYVARCIESILSQEFTDYEIILIDDGSFDDSGKICDYYACNDVKIIVVHKDNGGVSSARNVGIKIARGDYIWFVDSDDFIDKNSLCKLNEIVSNNTYDLVIFNHRLSKSVVPDLDELFHTYYFKYLLGFEVWNKLYRRDIIINNSLMFDIEEKIGEDLLFNINYYCHTSNMRFLDNEFYNYVNREGSAMNTSAKTRHINQMKLYDKIYFMLENKVSKEILQILFIMQLISGVNQSHQGGGCYKEYVQYLPLYMTKYEFSDKVFRQSIKTFLDNEKSSFLGKARIRLFFALCRKEKYKWASKIIFY